MPQRSIQNRYYHEFILYHLLNCQKTSYIMIKLTVCIHLLMLLDTSSVMFLEFLGVSGLSASSTLLQVTQPGLIRPQLVSRWLATPLLSHSHLEALSAPSVVPADGSPQSSPGSPSGLLAVADQSCILGELPCSGLFQAIFPWDCQLRQHNLLCGLRHQDNVWSQGGGCDIC